METARFMLNNFQAAVNKIVTLQNDNIETQSVCTFKSTSNRFVRFVMHLLKVCRIGFSMAFESDIASI